MKLSEKWIREWVDIDLSVDDLAEQLTMAGLEVDSVSQACGEFHQVIVGEVVSVAAHSNAKKLSVCQVNVGEKELLTIVCGADNVFQSAKVAVATLGGHVGDMQIKEVKLRGEASFGMLCSEKELGLAEQSNGIMILPEDAPIGVPLKDYLALDDHIIEIDLTPNRGDCLSVYGVARELAAINRSKLKTNTCEPVKQMTDDVLSVSIVEPLTCPQYCGRVIKGVDASIATPLWMQEKLRRSGLRSHSLIVDITNYVMMTIGQPLHAFDLDKIDSEIIVRPARTDESLTLLDGQTIKTQKGSLLIADKSKPLALAGVMGGLDSSVQSDTKALFLESAFFPPEQMAGVARSYGLQTDSSHRFERGVAPELQQLAIEMASELITSLAGGKAGPVTLCCHSDALPKDKQVALSVKNVNRLLGLDLTSDEVGDYLSRLGMSADKSGDVLKVSVPAYRFDISIAADLVEEVARMHGYNNIPETPIVAELKAERKPEGLKDGEWFRELMNALGYHESINYSFVCPEKHARTYDVSAPIKLVNPLSMDLSEMRTGLLVGLLNSALYNQNRQVHQQKLFEVGTCFYERDGEIHQDNKLAGLIIGDKGLDDWSTKTESHDFFDIKADVCTLLQQLEGELVFRKPLEPIKAYHPGISAEIVHNNKLIGTVGTIHPQLAQYYDLDDGVLFFELCLNDIQMERMPSFKPLSKFPSIRRDLSFLVDEGVESGAIQSVIKANNDDALLEDLVVFDVYQGDGVEKGKKSLAVGLTLQHPSRTLLDTDVNQFMAAIIKRLEEKFDIILRE